MLAAVLGDRGTAQSRYCMTADCMYPSDACMSSARRHNYKICAMS